MDIFAVPPIDGYDTDLDEDLSDDDHQADLNCLGPRMLKTACEIEIRTDNEENNETEGNELEEKKWEENEWDSSDDEPLAKYCKTDEIAPKKCKKSLTKNFQLSWKKSPPSFTMVTDCEDIPVSEEARKCITPTDFFMLFFNKDLLQHMLKQSNLYASQKNSPLNMTMDEMYVFLGGLLLSGYAKYPNKRLYWSSLSDVPKMLGNSIRLNRFEQILRNFHLNDNLQIDKEDRLYKLRPLITHLNKTYREHGGLEENISIDESMIPYYGKHYAKQYIRGKPIRFGFKNWAICSSTGYLYGFDIYTGKSDKKENVFGVGGDVVLKLIELAKVPPNKGFKIFFDNYFSSCRMMFHLTESGYCATGTIRELMTSRCPLPSKKLMEKKQEVRMTTKRKATTRCL